MSSRMLVPGAAVALVSSFLLLAAPSQAHQEDTATHAKSATDEEAARAMREVRAALASIDSSVTRVRGLLRLARHAGATSDATCIDGALTRANVAQRVARDHEARARAAWGRGDARGAREELARVLARREMAKEARSSAEACVENSKPNDFGVTPNQTVVRVVAPIFPDDDVGDFPTARR